MKTRNIKAFDREFDPNNSKTKCYIHKDGIEIPVYLKRNADKIQLSFTYRGNKYTSNEISFNSEEDFIAFTFLRIQFAGIDLDQIDINNLADCVDKMFETIADF